MYFAKLNSSRPKLVKRAQSWASDDEQVEIFCQLCCIAADVSKVMVDYSRGVIMGSMGWPDADSLQTSLAPLDSDLIPPMPGEEIHIVAENRHLRYEFRTTVIGVDEVGRWVLSCPDQIVNQDQRRIPRFQPRGWKAFLRQPGRMGDEVRARVVDLSVGGLAMIVPRDGYLLKKEQPQVGILLGPTGERLPLRSSICHVTPWEGSTIPKLLIGSTFSGFGVVNHARLARLLAARRT